MRALSWLVAAGLALVALLLLWPDRASVPADPVAARSAPSPPPDPGPPAPAAAAAAPPPAPVDPPTEPIAPDAAPTRALLRGALEAALATHLDRVKLSPAQLDELADAAWTLRRSRLALQALPPGPEHAEERRALVEASAGANEAFRRIVGMTPDAFTEAVQPDVGVDRYDPDEPIPEPEFIEAREE